MAGAKSHQHMLKHLKKQIRLLQRKEEQSRNQLRAAFKKMRQLSHSYKTKLATKVRVLKAKVAKAQASTYAKMAAEVERQLRKSMEAKGKAVAAAIAKIDKKHVVKLSRGVVKKAVKTTKRRPTKSMPSKKMRIKDRYSKR
jgi:hypothetical protein